MNKMTWWILTAALSVCATFGIRQWRIAHADPAQQIAKRLFDISRSEEISEPWDAYPEVAEEIPAAMIPRVLAITEQWQDREACGLVRNALISKWSKESPKQALLFAENFISSEDRDEAIVAIIQNWARKEPSASEKWVLETKDSERRTNFGNVWLNAVSRVEPLRALRVIESKPFAVRSVGAVFAGVAEKDLERALAAVENLDPELRPDAVYAIAMRRSIRDPQGAIIWLEGRKPEEVTEKTWLNLVENVAKTNPPEAIACAEKHLNGDILIKGVGRGLAEWARKDTDAALAWFYGLKDKERQHTIYAKNLGSIQIWSAKTALRLFQEFGVSHVSTYDLDKICRLWAEQDLAGFREWSMTVRDETAQAIAWKNVSFQWFAKDKAEVVNWVRALPNSGAKAGAILGIAHLLPPNQTVELAMMLESCPESKTRAEAAAAIVSYFSEANSKAAWMWIEKWPPGPTREAVYLDVTRWVIDERPARAVELANQISDPKIRQRAFDGITFHWLQKDRAKGLKKIMESALPAEVKTEVMRNERK